MSDETTEDTKTSASPVSAEALDAIRAAHEETVARLRDELDSLRTAFDELRAERDFARQTRRRALIEAHRQADKLDAGCAAAREQGAALSRDLGGLFDALLAARAASGTNEAALQDELAGARASGEAFRGQLAEERVRFEAELEAAQRELGHYGEQIEGARAEQGRLRVNLDAARGRVRMLEAELSKANQQLALRTREMDAIREDAVTQVAEAKLKTGQAEGRSVQLEALLDSTRDTGRAIENDAGRIGEELARAADALLELANRHAEAGEAPPPPHAKEEDPEQQPPLFDTEPYRDPHPAFDASQTPPPSSYFELPKDGLKLKDVIEEVLRAEDTPEEP